MEPDIKQFFSTLLKIMLLGFLWLFANTALGIRMGFLFVQERISGGNLLYWLGSLASLMALIFYSIQQWKKMPTIRPSNLKENAPHIIKADKN